MEEAREVIQKLFHLMKSLPKKQEANYITAGCFSIHQVIAS